VTFLLFLGCAPEGEPSRSPGPQWVLPVTDQPAHHLALEPRVGMVPLSSPPPWEPVRRLTGNIVPADAWWRALGGEPGAYFGADLRVGDYDGDGDADLLVGTYAANRATVIDGLLTGGAVAEADVASFRLAPLETVLSSNYELMDIDGDGRGELLYNDFDFIADWHFVHLDPGATGVVDPSTIAPICTLATGSAQTYMQFGPPADADLDGDLDLWITKQPGGFDLDNRVLLVPGPLTGTLDAPAVALADYVLDPVWDMFPTGTVPTALGVGELGGSGTPDLAFAVRGWNYDGGAGAVVFVLDPPLVEAPLADVETGRILGEEMNSLGFASGVKAVPDLNEDGYEEVIFGGGLVSPFQEVGSGFYVVLGPPPAGDVGTEAISTVYESPPPYGIVSRVMSGDVDGDSVIDLVATGSGDYLGTVESYLFYGPIPTGIFDVGDADATFRDIGVAALADLDGDGVDDVVAAEDTVAAGDLGAVLVFQGGVL
jgi:hypothetical protein